MQKLIYKPRLINAHQHDWHYREAFDSRGRVIQGYLCECGKRDYIDLVAGIPSEFDGS